jgi:hypothetical protein
MKRILWGGVALFLFASAASATTLGWTAGWDKVSEPLNYSQSSVSWSVAPMTHKLSVTFVLKGATPNKLYQAQIGFFCTTFPTTFGQFPTNSVIDGNCTEYTRQGVTRTYAAVQLGVVTTDIHGNGSLAVVVSPIASGTYEVEFSAEDGAGCGLIGGKKSCIGDFQSPGPFGTTTTITIP